MKILIVEDDRVIRESLKEGLEDESYAVDTASDGYEGYLSASADEFDQILAEKIKPLALQKTSRSKIPVKILKSRRICRRSNRF
ncbi:MAG: hypothetical protein WAV68_00140 [Candidatus Nanogingivalis sp.]